MSQAEVNVIPENIRANLAKCTKHTNLTCLECGYTGLIGVIRSETKRHVWALVPGLLVALYHIAISIWAWQQPFIMLHGEITSTMTLAPSWWLWVAGFVVIFVFGGNTKDFYLCPSCEKEIEKR